MSAEARAAEMAARTSYGRLLAYLARAWRDVAAVEDALADAFAKALATWPKTGAPANPDAWLLVAARNRLRDAMRSQKVRAEAARSLLVLTATELEDAALIADKRLELMFVCAHPAIDAAVRTPMMLQTVLGLTAQRIASSYLVSTDTMSRRLSRAKARIKTTGISFELPTEEDLPERMCNVLEAIYAAYGQGWDGAGGDDGTLRDLAPEAIWLARMLVELEPHGAEALGLLALLLFCESRSAARRVDGRYVPLAQQDTGRWNLDMAREAERLLAQAGALRKPGRFQLEAAIQSANVQSRLSNTDLSGPIMALHTLLARQAPTVGNMVGLVAATAAAKGTREALTELALLPAELVVEYQPYWALKADLLHRLGDDREVERHAFSRAIGLTEDPAVRQYLLEKSFGGG